MILRRRVPKSNGSVHDKNLKKDLREIDYGEAIHRTMTKHPRKMQIHNNVDLVCLLSIGASIFLLFLSNIPLTKSETSFDVPEVGYTVQRESLISPHRDTTSIVLPTKSDFTDQITFHFAPRNERTIKNLPDDFSHFYLEKELIHPISTYTPKLDEYDLNGTVYNEEDFTDDTHTHADEWYMSYYSFDDDYNRNDSTRNKSCRATAFHRNHHPTCNIAHESPILSDAYEGYYFSSGTFRDAFSIYDDELVLKIGSYQSMPYNYELHEMIRIDANVMNQLSTHKQIVNLYTHCGISLIVESINGPRLDTIMMNDERKELIEQGKDEDSLPDRWTPTQKLDMAIKMAEALSLLHSHPGGVIVHGDVQHVQYLLDEDGESVILSDFNRAEPLLFDESTGEYCKYVVGRGGGNVRAPEEYSEEPLNESIDVYSFGPVLYSILTGNEPFIDDHHIEEDETWHFIKEGLLPIVPAEIRGNSFAEAAMVAIMYKCFEFFPEKRIDIFTVISLLREAKALNDRLESIETSEFNFDRYNPRLMNPEYFENLSHQKDNHHDGENNEYHEEEDLEHHDVDDIEYYEEHNIDDNNEHNDREEIEYYEEHHLGYEQEQHQDNTIDYHGGGEDIEYYEEHYFEHDHEDNDIEDHDAEYYEKDHSELR